ncbi:MAG: right-handed parallel beta-helix repeat-containing protein [Candidatus Omnitrophica bacterium]|nr:right-handed parallel beta-helix repeat-containing protein [Candidatus Omnitrophota bacterium]
MRVLYTFILLTACCFIGPTFSKEAPAAMGHEFHVAINGDDANDGSSTKPLRSISAAAKLAQPGDTITVHEGVYREWVNPPRGGESDEKRITYQAAPGETVEIKGSEVIKGWKRIEGDVWQVKAPNDLFGEDNPYQTLIHGDWFNPLDREHHTGAVYLNGEWLMEAAKLDEVQKPDSPDPLWYGEVGEATTTIWARFKDADPNKELVEINARPAVFYPKKTGTNYITVRGFDLSQAATQWAPPTAEQIGLIGTHWSKDWIIENNHIHHSKCVGVTLGKYGDQWDNTSENTAEGYVLTIERALKNGWSKEQVGGHIVRDNTISHCEQAGIVGSLGAIFSRISGNTIHDIHVHRLFTGAEMAGIKIHAAVDTEISGNRIYRTVRGIWLDWMAQGTRVIGNLLYENGSEDLFVEVNHGPFLVDNNIFLSKRCLFSMSEGGAYVHNLMAGGILLRPESTRDTPYLEQHSTEVAGLVNTSGGDDRYYNNLFVGGEGLAGYDQSPLSSPMSGNVFLKGAVPSLYEEHPLVEKDFDPKIRLLEEGDQVHLKINLDSRWGNSKNQHLVTSELLGLAKIPEMPYVNPDGSPLRVDHDYFGNPRSESHPFPGPFELHLGGQQSLKVWPKSQ